MYAKRLRLNGGRESEATPDIPDKEETVGYPLHITIFVQDEVMERAKTFPVANIGIKTGLVIRILS